MVKPINGPTAKRRPTFLPAHGALYLLLAEQFRHDANDFRVAGLVTMLRHRGFTVNHKLDAVRSFTHGYSTPEATVAHVVKDLDRRMFGEDPAMREVAWFELELLCAGARGTMHRVGGRDLQKLLEKELKAVLKPKISVERMPEFNHLRLAYLKR